MNSTNVKMPVSFDTNPVYLYFNKEPKDSSSSDYLQQSRDRQRAERSSLQGKYPTTYLDQALHLFKKCREVDVTVVFGNLGRHPIILNYFLDLAFTANETVGVMTPWEIECPYRVQTPVPALDVLIIVEPYFGYGVSKPLQVKHLLVLSSHLVLTMPKNPLLVTHFFVGLPPVPSTISNKFLKYTVFEPLPYHDGSVNQLPGQSAIHVDVTSSKSAQEAYLRLLTGREMLRDKAYTVGLLLRDEELIKKCVLQTRACIARLGWNIPWIQNGYFDDFKNTGQVIIIEKPAQDGQGLA